MAQTSDGNRYVSLQTKDINFFKKNVKWTFKSILGREDYCEKEVFIGFLLIVIDLKFISNSSEQNIIRVKPINF